MIIVASQRGDAARHGRHILNTRDNDHVTVHELRGYMSDDVMGALAEDQAIARGTRCKQHLYTASFNAPVAVDASAETYISTIDGYEAHMGLSGQPRMIVFHEKEGRRHAHATWSRIDRETMTAVQMSHYKSRSKDYAREQFLKHGWHMPKGLTRGGHKNPLNYTLEEHQQAKRMGRDAKDIKASIQDAWAISDDKESFASAMKERGYQLARGDRRGHVAVDMQGEVLSIARMVGKKAKDVRERLGAPADYGSVADTQAKIAQQMTPVIARHIRQHEKQAEAAMQPLKTERQAMVQTQQQLRTDQKADHDKREAQERQERSERFRKGFKGLWDRLTGKHKAIKQQNERETKEAKERDRLERERMIQRQTQERAELQRRITEEREWQARQREELQRDIERYQRLMTPQQKPQTRHQTQEHER